MAATTLLPPGKQCFAGASGALAGGSVYFYYPSTTTFKQTFQDSTQTTLNTQPIILDSNGCAIIYGVGVYRQVVYTGADNTTTLFFDQLTTDTSAFNSVFWASLSGGTANVITITDTGFNATDGSMIQFIALATNTSSATLNPSGFGAISIVKDTTAGPIALTGGEIVAGNVISVVYYSTSNTFHLVNTVIASASGATSPLCGALGLVIANNSGTPNSVVDVAAAQAITQSSTGLVQNRSAVSVSINLSTGTVTSAANGMDGTTVGTNQWIYIWLIDNGSTAAGLGSTSSTSPNMPSGYTYKCRMGAMQVDSAGNLYRSRQLGALGGYTIVTGTNTADFTVTPLNIVNGIAGSTYSLTSPTLVTAIVTGNTKCGPSTATQVLLLGNNGYGGSAGSSVLAAPTVNYGGVNRGPNGSTGMFYPLFIVAGAGMSGSGAWITLESSTVGYASSGAGGALGCGGWRDSVNAN